MRPGPFLLALALCSPPAAAAYESGPVAEGGSIGGRVSVEEGHLAAAPATSDEADPCRHGEPPPSLVVGSDGGLADVAVFIRGIDRGKPVDQTRRGLLEFSRCRLRPILQVLAAAQVLEIRNSDPEKHIIRAALEGEEVLVRHPLPLQNQVLLLRLRQSGVVHFRCEADHDWERAYVVVMPHPYGTVTGIDGSFRLDEIPPGRYTLVTWHPTLGELTLEAEVTPGEETRVSPAYAGP